MHNFIHSSIHSSSSIFFQLNFRTRDLLGCLSDERASNKELENKMTDLEANLLYVNRKYLMEKEEKERALKETERLRLLVEQLRNVSSKAVSPSSTSFLPSSFLSCKHFFFSFLIFYYYFIIHSFFYYSFFFLL